MTTVETGVNPIDLTDKERVTQQIIERLGTFPIDYGDRMAFIDAQTERWLAASVLLILHYREQGPGRGFVLQLIKRSSGVPQPGDLSCPGGMLRLQTDRLFGPLIATGLFPFFSGRARRLARERGSITYRHLSVFLGNALREAWEEVSLNPLNLRFLGPLPSRELYVFSRVIFPLVALARRPWTFRPNWEVERIIEIPLQSLFEIRNYATLTVEVESAVPFSHQVEPVRNFPCFIVETPSGEEILWGATLFIIMNFLGIAFDFELTQAPLDRVVKKMLRSDYATGHHGTPPPDGAHA